MCIRDRVVSVPIKDLGTDELATVGDLISQVLHLAKGSANIDLSRKTEYSLQLSNEYEQISSTAVFEAGLLDRIRKAVAERLEMCRILPPSGRRRVTGPPACYLSAQRGRRRRRHPRLPLGRARHGSNVRAAV